MTNTRKNCPWFRVNWEYYFGLSKRLKILFILLHIIEYFNTTQIQKHSSTQLSQTNTQISIQTHIYISCSLLFFFIQSCFWSEVIHFLLYIWTRLISFAFPAVQSILTMPLIIFLPSHAHFYSRTCQSDIHKYLGQLHTNKKYHK